MTISLKLDDSDRERIERQLASGRFADASAVVSAGLELLEELGGARDHWLDIEIPARFADAEKKSGPSDLWRRGVLSAGSAAPQPREWPIEWPGR